MANLTGRQIVENGIITKVDNSECIQQVGVDLEVIEIRKIIGGGIVPKQGKTSLPEYEECDIDEALEGKDEKGWFLNPGAYDITLKQGCKIPNNQRLQIVQRSSLLRNGTILASSMFDPGFETENIGTVMIVSAPIFIEFEARVGQAYTTEVNEVKEEDLYNGQFQKDQQRK